MSKELMANNSRHCAHDDTWEASILDIDQEKHLSSIPSFSSIIITETSMCNHSMQQQYQTGQHTTKNSDLHLPGFSIKSSVMMDVYSGVHSAIAYHEQLNKRQDW